MSTANSRILSRLQQTVDVPRKMLSIPFKVENISNLDSIAKAMTNHSGNTTTRNMLIEDAIEAFIDEAILTLTENGIELDVAADDDFDTVIFPAQDCDEYRNAFFNECKWYYIRIDKRKIQKIKYIAIYVGAPTSAITHYAKVAPNGFEFIESEQKYCIHLDGAPIQLPAQIPLGSASPLTARSQKYTTIQTLFTAAEYKELYRKE